MTKKRRIKEEKITDKIIALQSQTDENHEWLEFINENFDKGDSADQLTMLSTYFSQAETGDIKRLVNEINLSSTCLLEEIVRTDSINGAIITMIEHCQQYISLCDNHVEQLLMVISQHERARDYITDEFLQNLENLVIRVSDRPIETNNETIGIHHLIRHCPFLLHNAKMNEVVDLFKNSYQHMNELELIHQSGFDVDVDELISDAIELECISTLFHMQDWELSHDQHARIDEGIQELKD